MKTIKRIGYDLSTFDRIGFVAFTSIVLFVIIRYFTLHLWILVLIYGIYVLNLLGRKYLYIDGNSFLVKGVFKSERISKEEFLNVTSAGLASFFANYCYVNFKTGRSVKIMAENKDFEGLEATIKNLISNNVS